MIRYLAELGFIVAMGILMSAMPSVAADKANKSEHSGRPVTNWDAPFFRLSLDMGW